MPAQSLPQPDTFVAYPSLYLGDDTNIKISVDDDPIHPVTAILSVTGRFPTVATLNYSPAGARKHRDALTLALVELESATITAAGFEDEDITAARLAAPEFPVARSFGEAVVVDSYDADLAIVRSFSTPGVTS